MHLLQFRNGRHDAVRDPWYTLIAQLSLGAPPSTPCLTMTRWFQDLFIVDENFFSAFSPILLQLPVFRKRTCISAGIFMSP